ncbi:leucine-rich repeat protein [[Clostridium] symbiosum]|uniref:leucine-rich repeat protein n=1 Tax=Clostridium symbiosum TaxID=1512 RepID=UPI0018974CEA|nr:leucine-rich repeat domain-containing protein [[Clostridium] symbiosum]MDB2016726.1 leucine-rich repeat protein [[Clostridium] symbiosum]
MKQLLAKILIVVFLFTVTPVECFAEVLEKGSYQYEIADSLYESDKEVAYIYEYIASDSEATVKIPSKIDGYAVEGIGHIAFKGNNDIKKIIIPNGVKFIGVGAFEDCTNLSSVILPDSIKEILGGAFSGCDSLKEFTIPNGIEEIHENSISGDKLKTVINKSDKDINMNVLGYSGATHAWYLDKEGKKEAEYIPAKSSIYKMRRYFAYDYLRDYANVLPDKVDSEIVNTKSEMEKYILSFQPENTRGNYEVRVDIYSFQQAQQGTKSNPEGAEGWASFYIKAQNKDKESDESEYSFMITIQPNRFGIAVSSGTNKNRAEKNINRKELKITKNNIFSGTWEACGNRWKLLIDNGRYASSQWAYLENTWYLIGDNEYMLTGWNEVNGRWYYLSPNGNMLTEWQLIDGRWYFFESSGEMVIGWKWVGEKCYYFDSNGAMLSNMKTPDGFYVNEQGEWIS